MQKDGLGNIMLKCVELFQQIILNTLKEIKVMMEIKFRILM